MGGNFARVVIVFLFCDLTKRWASVVLGTLAGGKFERCRCALSESLLAGVVQRSKCRRAA